MPSHEEQTWINAGTIALLTVLFAIAFPFVVTYLRKLATRTESVRDLPVVKSDVKVLSDKLEMLSQRFDSLLARDHVHVPAFEHLVRTVEENSNRLSRLEVYMELLRNHREEKT